MTLRIGDDVQRIVCSKSKRVAAERADIQRPLGLCKCCPSPGSPLLVEYGGGIPSFADVPGIWRYESLLPVKGVPAAYAADVGRTPIVKHDALGNALDVEVS